MRNIPRTVKWLPVAIATFALGAIIVAIVAWGPCTAGPGPAAPAILPELTEEPSCTIAVGYPGRSVDVDEIPKPRPKFFPRSPGDTRDRNFDPFLDEWYGKHLRALGDRSLLEKPPADNGEVYRFTWLRAFHRPVVVRVDYNGYGASLISRETDGKGGYEPGKIIRTDRLELRPGEWCRFTELLNAAGFWSMPSQINDGGRDGSQWILEGIRGNRYHVTDRWTPGKNAYHDAGAYLLQLSGRDTRIMGSEFY